MYEHPEPRDWMHLGEVVFGVSHHERNVRWLPAKTEADHVHLAAAQRQQQMSLTYQEQARELATALGQRYSLRWLASRLHTLDYHGAYAVLRGRTRINFEHVEDFTQAVSPATGTVNGVVDDGSH